MGAKLVLVDSGVKAEMIASIKARRQLAAALNPPSRLAISRDCGDFV